jgi:hypothetical protein
MKELHTIASDMVASDKGSRLSDMVHILKSDSTSSRVMPQSMIDLFFPKGAGQGTVLQDVALMCEEAHYINQSLDGMTRFFYDRVRTSADIQESLHNPKDMAQRRALTYNMLAFLDGLVPPTIHKPTRFVLMCALKEAERLDEMPVDVAERGAVTLQFGQQMSVEVPRKK